MRRVFLYSCLSLLCLGFAVNAWGQAQTIVPAGTLLQCTMNEPNFSSATANVGDPVVCYLRSVQQFGHIVLPRGSYLEGHLAAEKDPGHFFGKGYLRLEFDRIGLPSTDIPVPSKVIAASGGYKTDREGDVKGKGHPRRDAVEWLFPPLWPWKVISLPARGPRATFKGEELLTLRLMDDVVVPKMADLRPAPMPGWRYFGQPSGALQNGLQPHVAQAVSYTATNALSSAAAPAVSTGREVTLIALANGDVLGVTKYRVEDGQLNYVLSGGTEGSADVHDVDWTKTSALNTAKAQGNIVARGD